MTRTLPLSLTLIISLCPRGVRADPPSWLDRAVVAEVTRRAVRHARLDDDDLRAMASRARGGGWLPRVTVRVARGFGATSTQYAAVQSDRVATDDSLLLDLRLSLALDRVLFDPHEVQIQRIAAQRAAQRRELETSVVELLARLEQIRRAGALADEDPRVVERLRLRARLEQLTGAALDAGLPTAP